MDSIAVTKADMTVSRQEALSPFGLLTQLFTAELARRSTQTIGSYRPMQLAYLEDEEPAAQPAPTEINFDLDVNLLVDRLLDRERKKEKNEEKKAPTATERIIERVILRETELRTAYRDSRRVVIEGGGQRFSAVLPAKEAVSAPVSARKTQEEQRIIEQGTGQAGEGRSTGSPGVLRRSAALTPSSAPSGADAGTASVRRIALQRPALRTLPLASRTMSVPAAGGWTPQQRQAHPGYPSQAGQAPDSGAAVGSILLPDVLRRRREAALEARSTVAAPAEAPEPDRPSPEDALTWLLEETETVSETERIRRAVHAAVEETLRRNALRGFAEHAPSRPEAAAEAPQSAETGPSRSRGETARTAADALVAARSAAPARAQPGAPGSDRQPERDSAAAYTGAEAAYPAAAEAPGEAEANRQAAGSPARERDALTVTEAAASETAPASVRPAAVPAEAEEETAGPAELVYYESDASAEQPAPQRRGPAKVPAAPVEARPTPGTARHAAPEAAAEFAAASAVAETEPAAHKDLVYREPMAEQAAPEPGKSAAAPAAENQTHTAPLAARPAVPVSASAAAIMRPRAETSERDAAAAAPMPAAVPAAIPAGTEEKTAAPAELVYREEPTEEPAPKKRTEMAAPMRGAPAGAQKRTEMTAPMRGAPAGAQKRTEMTAPMLGAPAGAQNRTEMTAPMRGAPAGAQKKTEMTAPMRGASAGAQKRAEMAAPMRGEPAKAQKRTEMAAPMRGAPAGAQAAEMTYTMAGAERSPAAAEASAAVHMTAQTEPAERDAAEAAALAAAVPAETAAETAVPAELVYRAQAAEMTYTMAGAERSPAAAEASAAVHMTAQTEPAERDAAEAAALAAALPAETAAETAVPAELVYRAQAETVTAYAGETERSGRSAPAHPTGTPQRGSAAAQRIGAQTRPDGTVRTVRAVGQAARDIRTAAAHRAPAVMSDAMQTARRAEPASQGAPTPDESVFPPTAAVPVPGTPEAAAPPELVFAGIPAPGAGIPAGETPERAAEPPRTDATAELPAWAKELLEQSGVTDTVRYTEMFAGKSGARQITWSMPGAADGVRFTAPAGPAELSFRERGEAEKDTARAPISDAELQHTADRVYRIIEERLRRELRRSGR